MRLTVALIEQICQRLRAGAFEQVAVESLSIPYATFQEWLRRGQGKRAGRLYRQLADAVRAAQAEARLLAEMKISKEDAKVWLLSGPGRATDAQDGWGSAATAGRSRAGAAQAAGDEVLLELCAVVLQALLAFPEARSVVAAAIDLW